jgi:hypothetical protein
MYSHKKCTNTHAHITRHNHNQTQTKTHKYTLTRIHTYIQASILMIHARTDHVIMNNGRNHMHSNNDHHHKFRILQTRMKVIVPRYDK